MHTTALANKTKQGKITMRARLRWFELFLPPGIELSAVVDVLRPLATRPRIGWYRHTPLVVFELHASAGALHWLLGVEERIQATVPSQLRAQLDGLRLTEVEASTTSRSEVTLASAVRVTGLTQQVRIELAAQISSGLFHALQALEDGEAATVQWMVGHSNARHSIPPVFDLLSSLGVRPYKVPDAHEKKLWRQKADEPVFGAVCRVGAAANTKQQAQAIITTLTNALRLGDAALATVQVHRASKREARNLVALTWPGLARRSLLSAPEVAALIGWPLKGLSPSLGFGWYPTPPSLLSPGQKFQAAQRRVLGTSLHPADNHQLVTLSVGASLHHTHVVGATGSGKSTLLGNLVRADMQAGRGCLVIEPRGDLVADVLAGVPAHRADDVVVIDPGRSELVVGVNPLSGPAGEAERRADDLLHLFKRLHGKGLGARSSDILLHCLIALSRLADGTLADLPVVLSNSSFRRRVLSEVNDPLTLGPFFAQYDTLSEVDRFSQVAPLMNKVRAFLSRSEIRRLVGQANPRFQLDELFTKQRIVLVNLNEGIIGGETASLVGALLVTQLWQAIQRRARVPVAERQPVMVVIDEVHRFLKLPVDVGEMLAQCRGLGVGLTVAHQHLGQLSEGLRAGFLTNARTKVVFKPSAADAVTLARAMEGKVKATDFGQLQAFQACVQTLVDRTSTHPFAIRTRPLGPALSDPSELRNKSTQRYGTDGNRIDALHVERWRGDTSNVPEQPATSGGEFGMSERSA